MIFSSWINRCLLPANVATIPPAAVEADTAEATALAAAAGDAAVEAIEEAAEEAEVTAVEEEDSEVIISLTDEEEEADEAVFVADAAVAGITIITAAEAATVAIAFLPNRPCHKMLRR